MNNLLMAILIIDALLGSILALLYFRRCKI